MDTPPKSTPPAPAPPPPDDPRAALAWLGYALGGVGLVMSILAYTSITGAQAHGGKIHVLVAVLYRIGGKWFAVGSILAFSLACLGGALYLRHLLKQDTPE